MCFYLFCVVVLQGAIPACRCRPLLHLTNPLSAALHFSSKMDSSPQSGQKRAREPSGIKGVLAEFKAFIEERAISPTDEEFEAFSWRMLLFYLIIHTLKASQDSNASTSKRQDAVSAMFESLYFPSHMSETQARKLNEDMMTLIYYESLPNIFSMYHSACFPKNEQVRSFCLKA